jgi:hypothetical protein
MNSEIAANNKFRTQANEAIADIEKAQGQANRARGIADNLAKGTAEGRQAVLDTAPAAIEEFKIEFTAADALVKDLTSKVEKANATINKLTSADSLNEKQAE